MQYRNYQRWVAIVGLASLSLGCVAFFLKETKVNQTEAFLATSKEIDDAQLWQDKETQLVWSKCHLGQVWQAGQCTGELHLYSWTQAQERIAELNQQQWLGYNDWRMPEISEWSKYLHCSTGFLSQMQIPSVEQSVVNIEHGCQDQGYVRPTLVVKFTLSTPQSDWYWSATSYKVEEASYQNNRWGIYLSSGYIYDLNKESLGYVYLVRSL